MRTGQVKANVISVINTIIVSDFERMLFITVAPSSWQMNIHICGGSASEPEIVDWQKFADFTPPICICRPR